MSRPTGVQRQIDVESPLRHDGLANVSQLLDFIIFIESDESVTRGSMTHERRSSMVAVVFERLSLTSCAADC